MKKTNKFKVAIIGLGNIAQAVASDLVKNNRPVILAGRDFAKSKEISQTLGTLVQPMEIGSAIREADIIIMAVWFDSIKELLYQYESVLEGKIIIDPSNPIAPDGKGGFVKKIGVDESAGQVHSKLLPKSAKLAKALGTVSAASLTKASNQEPELAVLFYATDDITINGEIEELIHDMGFEPVRVGGIDEAIRIEVFGDLHEFGALGKTITLSQVPEIALV